MLSVRCVVLLPQWDLETFVLLKVCFFECREDFMSFPDQRFGNRTNGNLFRVVRVFRGCLRTLWLLPSAALGRSRVSWFFLSSSFGFTLFQ